MIILLKMFKILSYLHDKPLIVWPCNFPETIHLLKVNCFEGSLNRIKINGMENDHSSNYNFMKILLKSVCNF